MQRVHRMVALLKETRQLLTPISSHATGGMYFDEHGIRCDRHRAVSYDLMGALHKLRTPEDMMENITGDASRELLRTAEVWGYETTVRLNDSGGHGAVLRCIDATLLRLEREAGHG